jgi:hypothetical protein
MARVTLDKDAVRDCASWLADRAYEQAERSGREARTAYSRKHGEVGKHRRTQRAMLFLGHMLRTFLARGVE